MVGEVVVGELVSLGVQKIWDLLSHEYEQFQGVEDQVSELKSDLNLLKSFLRDADSKKHTSELVKHCVEEIKEIVYDAEDVIESFLLKEKLGKTGIKNRIRKLACIVPDRRGFASYIGVMRERISTVIKGMQSFGVENKIAKGSMQREMRKTFSEDDESDLVGLEANVETLVGYLVENDDIQIVSVTGMGGLGKTTLARQVFNHEMVKNKFDGLAWVCVSQDFSRISVWQTILQNLTFKGRKDEIKNMNEDELQKELIQLLKTSKPLIVFDDVWKDEDWGEIKKIFPSKKGWKVLLTSRYDHVAMRRDTTYVNLKPKFLTDPDSWTLFERIAMPGKDDSEYKVYEKCGKKMVKHCKGLPLAIRTLGGLLKTVTVSDWERLSTSIGSHNVIGRTSANNNSIDRILSMSFEELPNYLKHCFLYLAHFPEDYAIYVEDLTYYWAAEGIPRPRYYDGATIRQVADGYIEELVKRNMIISKRDATTSRFETCQLHDVMREVCLLKAEEENFVHIVETSATTATPQSPCKSRRIAVHQLDKSYDPKWEIQNPKLRSLLIIRGKVWMASSLCFTRLQLMRVLDLSHAEFEGGKLPSSIGKLIHLKYLNLCMAYVTHLPSSMRNLKQLIYLNLWVQEESSVYIPNFMKEMRELTYLHLPKEINDWVKIELGNLVNLETLKNFSTKHSSAKDLQRMTKLRILSINIRGTTKTLSSSLSELRYLEDLFIYDEEEKEKEGFVLDCVHLKRLDLRIYMPRLPDEQHFPSHLTTIILTNCCLVEDPMPILEKLVQLKELQLWDNCFIGRSMVCSGGGFPQLQELFFHGLFEWEEWKVEEGSMPLLHSLTIIVCPKLKELPGQHLFSHLTFISLLLCGLEEDPMPILEKLLQLKDVRMCVSFSGRRMVCSGGGFPQLQKLWISKLDEWEEWIVEEGSMPNLHTLEITKCRNLKEIPDGLKFITSLKHLTMDEKWKEKMSEGGEDYYKIQHIPFVQFEGDDY